MFHVIFFLPPDTVSGSPIVRGVKSDFKIKIKSAASRRSHKRVLATV
jgi:hypothetical protein